MGEDIREIETDIEKRAEDHSLSLFTYLDLLCSGSHSEEVAGLVLPCPYTLHSGPCPYFPCLVMLCTPCPAIHAPSLHAIVLNAMSFASLAMLGMPMAQPLDPPGTSCYACPDMGPSGPVLHNMPAHSPWMS